MNNAIQETLYDVKQVAKMLSVDPETVRRWHREGKIRTVQIGAGWIRIPESEIKKIIGE